MNLQQTPELWSNDFIKGMLKKKVAYLYVKTSKYQTANTRQTTNIKTTFS